MITTTAGPETGRPLPLIPGLELIGRMEDGNR